VASEAVIAMRKHVSQKIRVGIIGANPDRGWAMQAHIPALKSLSDEFEITALSCAGYLAYLFQKEASKIALPFPSLCHFSIG